MGKLVLTSGGYLDGQRGKECDSIIEQLTKDKNVLLIDNATLTGSNVKGADIVFNNFKNIVKNVVRISLSESNLEVIKNYDTIYITGGDLAPFILLIEKCDLKGAFVNYLKNGGNIIGESAGSMIFGNDLKWIYEIKKGTKPKYDIILQTYKGLGIIDIKFFPHWNKANSEMINKVNAYEKKYRAKITKVSDNEFLEFDF